MIRDINDIFLKMYQYKTYRIIVNPINSFRS